MQKSQMRSYRQRLGSPRVILPFFAILGLIGVLNHAMWRDEMNTWLIVRDSQSLGELLGYVTYQGHPALWALLVAAVQTVAATPVAMQLLHWGLGVSAVALFWRYSHFARWQKILFTFGYLPFYEYFLISRPYVLGMLFLFGFCALYPTRHRSYIAIALVLGLMANSHAFAALISLAAALTLGAELLLDGKQRSRYRRQAPAWDLIVSLVILMALYAFAYAILSPPVDSVNAGGPGGWNFSFDLRHLLRVLGRLLGGYTLIIPDSSRWLDLIFCDVIGIAMVLLVGAYLLRYRTPFLFYGLANGILLSFFYVRYLGHGARHYGYVYLVLIVALWLAQFHSEVDGRLIERLRLGRRSRSLQKTLRLVFTLILLFHLGGGLYRYGLDLSVPFSGAKAAAQYLRRTGLDQEFIVASPDANMAALAGYLDRSLYYPEVQRLGSFTLFQAGRRDVDQATILQTVQALLPSMESCRILLVLSDPLQATRPDLAIAPIAQFQRSWHESEQMYLYWVTPQPPVPHCSQPVQYPDAQGR